MPVNLLPALVGSVINAVTSLPATTPTSPMVISRSFPEDAKVGALSSNIQLGSVYIEGTQYTTAPGLQVRNESNLIIMPNTVQSGATVKYQVDAAGSVSRLWVLSSAEASAAR